MAEYVDPEGGSFSESQGKRNPFLMVQSVSASPIGKHSPMKDFGIFSIPAAIAAIKAAGSAVAATKVGAAVVGAAKAVGGKLAATKIGGAVVKAAKFVGKGVKAIKGTKVVKGIKKGVDAVKKFTGKITGKANIGAKPTGTATTTANVTETTKTGVDVAKEGFKAPEKTFTQKIGDYAKGKIKQETSFDSITSRVKSGLDKGDVEGEEVAAGHRQRAGELYSSLPSFGGGSSKVPSMSGDDEENELGSVLTFKRSLLKKHAPLRLRAKNAISPFKIPGKMAYDAELGTASASVKQMMAGEGFGINPVSFSRDEKKQIKYM